MPSEQKSRKFLFSKVDETLFEGDTINAEISLPQRFVGKKIYWDIVGRKQFSSETSGLFTLGDDALAKISLTAKRDEIEEEVTKTRIRFYTVKDAKKRLLKTNQLIAKTRVSVEDLDLGEGDRGRLPIVRRSRIPIGRSKIRPRRLRRFIDPAPQIDEIQIGKNGYDQYISLTFDKSVQPQLEAHKGFTLKNQKGETIPFWRYEYDDSNKNLKLYTGSISGISDAEPFSFENNERYSLLYRATSSNQSIKNKAKKGLPFAYYNKDLYVHNTIDGRNWLAFSGGGTSSHTNLSGFFAAALDLVDKTDGVGSGRNGSGVSLIPGLGRNQALDHLMAPVSGIAATSGGAWFLSQLGYSDKFNSNFLTKEGRDNYFDLQNEGYYGQHKRRHSTLINRSDENLLEEISPERLFWGLMKDIAEILADEDIEKHMTEFSRYVRIGEILRFLADEGDGRDQWVQWRDLNDKYIYEPFGMASELSGKALDQRLPWLEDKDLAFTVTLPNNDQTINGLMLYPGAKDAAFNKVSVSTQKQPLATNQFIDASFVSSPSLNKGSSDFLYNNYFHLPSMADDESMIFQYDPITPLEAGDALVPEEEACFASGWFVCSTTFQVDLFLNLLDDITETPNRRSVQNNVSIGDVDIIDVATASSAAGGFTSMVASMLGEFLWDYDGYINSLPTGALREANEAILDTIKDRIESSLRAFGPFVSVPSAVDGLEFHFRQMAPLFSFAEGSNFKVDYIDEPGSLDLFSDEFIETFDSKDIANQRQIRLMDGGYHDNTSAAHAMHQIQKKLEADGELNAVLSSKNDEPTFELSIFAQSHSGPTSKLPHIPSDPSALKSVVAGGPAGDNDSGLIAKVPGDVAKLFGVEGSTKIRLNQGYQGDSDFLDGDFFQRPKVQIFDLVTAWSDAEPSFSQGFSYVPLSGDPGERYDDNQIVIYELDVETVDNELFGVRGGQKGRVNLVYSTNEHAMNMTTDFDVFNSLQASYDNIRDKVGADESQSIMNIFDWNVEYDLKDSIA